METAVSNAAIFEEKPDQGITIYNGREHMIDAKGRLTPIELIKPQDKLIDETVRKIIRFAKDLSAQIERFKAHTMADLTSLDELLDQQYGFVKQGNKGKGNRTYMTVDGLMKVTVKVADFIDFGPELQTAKSLIDECLNEWSQDSNPQIRHVITRAFNTDKEGQINRSEVFMLLGLAIDDPRWLRAMDAIRDAIRVVGSKEYINFAVRSRQTDEFTSISINLAKAGAA